MTSWKDLAILAIAISTSVACSRKHDDGDDLQSAEVGSQATVESIIYYYVDHGTINGCESNQEEIEFRGDDLKNEIFTSMASHPKEEFEASHACRSGSSRLWGIRLRLIKSDRSTEVLASPYLGCGEAASPDLAGIIPWELQLELYEALHPKYYQGSAFRHSKVAVYFRYERLTDADVNSFEVLTGEYAQDKSHIFYQQKILEGADQRSFVSLTSGWAKDQNHAYYRGAAIELADPQTLSVDKINSDYAVDSKQVYYRGKSIAGVNTQNFACIHNYFCWNNSQVLFIDTPVADVDAPSFVVDSCKLDYSAPSAASLCSAPGPKPTKVICQVHDKDRSFVLEHKAPEYP